LDTDIPTSGDDPGPPDGAAASEAGPGGPSAWLTIPNLLSLGRLALTPVLVWMILSPDRAWAAGVLFGVMAATDYLDGYIARATNTVTDLGTTLDPVSDRVLALAAGIAMISSGILPAWLGIPVILRDVVLSIAFLALARRGFGKPKVRRVGKTATFALLTAMPALVLGQEIEILRTAGLVVFAVGGVLYFVAFFRYYQDVQHFLAKERAPFTS
jgi:CDP-diacylglycerol--glycerol-3-phosphate 3-phosphatidyltransferase